MKPTLTDINSNEPLCYQLAVSVNICRGRCNTNSDPYPQVCVLDKVKNVNAKAFSLMSRVNKTRFNSA